MIQAQLLPPSKSVYDYPAVVPGEEPTEEQQQQMIMAQIAGVILAVAAAKKGIEAATTNQLIAVLRTSNLLTASGVEAFVQAVKLILPVAKEKAREITWSGFANRATLVGIDFPEVMPTEEQIPKDIRYSRSSSIENAYRRVAKEYKENLERDRNDPIIAELVDELEKQGMTPLPRPDNLSNDAVQRVVSNEETWVQAFRKAEAEAREAQSGRDAEEALAAEVRANLTTSPSEGEWHRADVEAFAGDDTAEAIEIRNAREAEERAERERKESAASTGERKPDGDGDEEPVDDGDPEDGRLVELTDAEVDEIIERYAEHKAEERVERMVSQDIQGTSRNAHQLAMRHTDPKQVKGFRRIVHPELSESGRSCGLCIVASTMRYTRRDLLPIHSGCNCETAEIYEVNGEEFDPGHRINLQDLAVFYGEAGNSTHGWDLKRQKYKVFDHPEYGPTLINDTSKKARENATEIEFN